MCETVRTLKASWKGAESLYLLCNSPKRNCNSPLFSLCVGLGIPSPENMMFHTWACSHRNMTANPSTEVKRNLGTARYFFLLFCTA
jgi:hypothetical protein